MSRVILTLLASFGLVLGLAVAFVVMYRRHVRQLRRQNRGLDQLAHITSARRRMLAYPLPGRWLAVRSSNTLHVREVLGLAGGTPPTWGESLVRARERAFFVSYPVDGWTLVIGAAIPDPAVDIDAAYRFLTWLSREVGGEVQFFSADRVLNFHGWGRLRDGAVVRAYVWAGETEWNEGRMTLDERLLGLRCREYGAEPEPLRYGETSPVQLNTERVPLLARRWGIDLASACEILLQHEGVESDDDAADRH